MVLLRFTKILEKLFDHSKKTTIRLHTKHREKYPIKEGERLYAYALFKIGEADITKIETKRLSEMTDEDAKRDGFKDYLELKTALTGMHEKAPRDAEWDLITFKPEWPAMKLVLIDRPEVYFFNIGDGKIPGDEIHD